MGLLFVCFQADLASGFLAVQARLNGEQLEEYIKPIGGELLRLAGPTWARAIPSVLNGFGRSIARSRVKSSR